MSSWSSSRLTPRDTPERPHDQQAGEIVAPLLFLWCVWPNVMPWKLCLPGLLAPDLDDPGSGLLGLGQSKHQQTILEDRLGLIRAHGHN